jgi:alpha-mannosidase
MRVEADCSLPSGESLVRQLLHGKNFWMDEFGVDLRNCWIPDIFGYAGSMPQILAKSGVDFFLTQKLSWSKFNEFPHDTFRWRGIDGTKVTTHFLHEQTYNSSMTPADLRRAERTFHEKAFLDEFITLIGIGDGGGGPKEEHLERALRSRNLENLPKASFERADDLFARLASHSAELDVWVGELCLEYHRGTYTTQARTKKNNRRLEQELRRSSRCGRQPTPAWAAAIPIPRLSRTPSSRRFFSISSTISSPDRASARSTRTTMRRMPVPSKRWVHSRKVPLRAFCQPNPVPSHYIIASPSPGKGR